MLTRVIDSAASHRCYSPIGSRSFRRNASSSVNSSPMPVAPAVLRDDRRAGWEIVDHDFDVVVVGTGGAGLRAAIGLAEHGYKAALVSKVYPTRSHTVAAQGGVNAALGNMGDSDDWRFHARDTIKGSDWLCDQDAVHFMCREAPATVVELERYGVPFSRTKEGLIYQRAFGGQTLGPGGATARRTCACADRTGHAIIQTLFGQAIKKGCTFFQEFFAIDLIGDAKSLSPATPNECRGVMCYCPTDGTMHRFRAHQVVLATGGAGRCYATTTAGHACTGDGNGMALRFGVPLEDMEFVQFHPTGVYGAGCLITEAVRGEGGYLVNGEGERFMPRYAPQHGDLASRDVVSRAMSLEIAAGRGCGPKKDHLYLKLDHLPRDVIDSRLPGIAETAKIFAGVDVHKEPIPVLPTAHYSMGGIPTNIYGEVRATPQGENFVPGLMAAGEAACVSVHGANRLGANSLLDIVVFGRAVADRISKTLKPGTPLKPLPVDAGEESIAAVDALLKTARGGGAWDSVPSVSQARSAMQWAMQKHAAVFRTGESLELGKRKLEMLMGERFKLRDGSKVMNTELMEALELRNMMGQSLATMASALGRQESRGAHAREDFPERDDNKWLKHSFANVTESGKVELSYRAVNLKTLDEKEMTPMPLSQRKY